MSRVYLHSKNKINTLNKLMVNILVIYICYGFYKNGISLYANDYVNILGLFKPLLFVLISIVISFSFKKKDNDYWGFRFLQNLLIAVIVPYNTNVIIYLIIVTILNFLLNYIKINIVPIFMVIVSALLFILKKYSFLNVYETLVDHNFSFFDFLLGKGYGGISNTLLMLSVISFVVLLFNINYKKQIPIVAFCIYYILAMITVFITGVLDQNLLINNNVIFAFVFISNISIFTPYTKGGCYIYGALLGILTFITYFIDVNVGVYIVIMILSFIYPWLDRFIVGKNDNALVDVL